GRLTVDLPLVLATRAGNERTTARGLHVHDAKVTEARAPTRVAVNLGGIALEGASRGDVLVEDARVRRTARGDVALEQLALETTPLRRGVAVTLYVGTARTAARVDAMAGARARLKLEEPLVVFGGDRVVLRGSANANAAWGAVAGGGAVLDARPPPKSRLAARSALFDALDARDPAASARALVADASPRPLAKDELRGRLPIDADAIAQAADRLVKSGELAAIGDRAWIARADLASLAAKARALVAAHHAAAPLDRGLPLETLRE